MLETGLDFPRVVCRLFHRKLTNLSLNLSKTQQTINTTSFTLSSGGIIVIIIFLCIIITFVKQILGIHGV